MDKSSCIESLENLISDELKTVALLSLANLNAEQIRQIKGLLTVAELERVKAQIVHHRVWPCAYHNIRDYFSDAFPAQIVQSLDAKYKHNVAQVQKQFLVMSEMLFLFKKAGIPAQPFKGASLAQKLYGDVAKRHCNDVDILIPQNRAGQASTLIIENGFRNESFYDLPEHLKSVYLKRHNDVVYTGRFGVLVELHHRLQSHSSTMGQEVGSKLLDLTLSDEDLFIYLCWHSSATLHHRLKWLTDICIYISKIPISWPRLYERAKAMDSVRCVVLNLALVKAVYGITLASEAESLFPVTRRELRMARESLKVLQCEPDTNTTWFQLRIVQREVLMAERWKSKWYVIRQVFKPSVKDIQFSPRLSRRFSFLLFILRPFVLFSSLLSKNK